MEFLYIIINFLILAAALFIFARKTVAKIFSSRMERVNRELDEIAEAEAAELPQPEEFVPEEEPEELSEQIAKAQRSRDDKLSQINDFERRRRNQMLYKELKKTRHTMFLEMQEEVEALFKEEPYRSKIREYESDIIDSILAQIKLTPGDLSYLKHSEVLYVTLTSAFPLPQELVDKVDRATTELLDTVNGKTSLWVLVDPSLVGGLRLRIGDTIYDGTVSEELYRFEKNLSNKLTSAEKSLEVLVGEILKLAENFTPDIHVYQVGRAMAVSDGICWMDGLADIMYGEVVEFECGERGMALDIERNRIGCVIFGNYENIESGSRVRRVGRIASVPVGEAMLGRVVDALGEPIDGEGFMITTEKRPIEFKAPAILDRAPVDTPMHTGIKAIDTLVSIGKGQRELIIGDRQTGKTSIAVDAIINQKGKNTICIYAAIGQKETSIAETRERLKAHGALDYTVIVSAPASESAALQYIAPFSATAIGEYFMYNGRDVLIVYDDLSKHAVAYRELSLLLHRPSGREAYPGDIFYLHSRLLERAANLTEEAGGGSLTALPIIETLGGDISAYIPTNVISITDGQIFLETDLFNEGQRPAINVSLSVSRVGCAAQTPLVKQVCASLRTRLAQYRELAEFMQFGADVDEETQKTLRSGRLLTEALKQRRSSPVADYFQALLIFAIDEGYANHIKPEEMYDFETGLFKFFEKEYPKLVERMKTGKKLDDSAKAEIRQALGVYAQRG